MKALLLLLLLLSLLSLLLFHGSPVPRPTVHDELLDGVEDTPRPQRSEQQVVGTSAHEYALRENRRRHHRRGGLLGGGAYLLALALMLLLLLLLLLLLRGYEFLALLRVPLGDGDVLKGVKGGEDLPDEHAQRVDVQAPVVLAVAVAPRLLAVRRVRPLRRLLRRLERLAVPPLLRPRRRRQVLRRPPTRRDCRQREGLGGAVGVGCPSRGVGTPQQPRPGTRTHHRRHLLRCWCLGSPVVIVVVVVVVVVVIVVAHFALLQPLWLALLRRATPLPRSLVHRLLWWLRRQRKLPVFLHRSAG